MKAPLERDVLRQCLELLHLRGHMAFRVNSGAFAGEYKGKKRFVRFVGVKGCSDILGCLKGGRFLAVETKQKGKKPTPEQELFLLQVNQMGGLGVVIQDVKELESILDQEDRKNAEKNNVG